MNQCKKHTKKVHKESPRKRPEKKPAKNASENLFEGVQNVSGKTQENRLKICWSKFVDTLAKQQTSIYRGVYVFYCRSSDWGMGNDNAWIQMSESGFHTMLTK